MLGSVGGLGVSTEFQNYSLSSLDFTPWLSDMGKTLRCQVDSNSIPSMDEDNNNNDNDNQIPHRDHDVSTV